MARLSEKILQELTEIVYRESGIVLKDKRELMEARLANLMRKKGYQSPQEVLNRLKNDSSGEALVEFLDQVSTNLTFFFREPDHFDFLARVLMPDLVARKKAQRNNRIRIWSAACSSGEEPYSLAIIVKDFLASDTSWDIKILATDISTKVLNKAIAGRYSKQEVGKAPPTIVQRYFQRSGDLKKPVYQVADEIRQMVVFRRLNLLQESYPFKGRFDLIVCRNVMIYFDAPTKQNLLRRFHRYLEDGAYLFTGHAESLTTYEHLFKRVQVAIYRR
ncbi:MAG: protein-glutamate O-methyltransferase CheR [Deltaproteobacteria bacterium]|nr:protein-glutamate O-methyltransferase CheR [Deltaproteobacteria bacterium]